MKLDGLIAVGIMKVVTISLGSSVKMTSDFRNMKKSATAYVASKGYKHWPGVIEIIESVDNKACLGIIMLIKIIIEMQ